jgi:hypothetical protein
MKHAGFFNVVKCLKMPITFRKMLEIFENADKNLKVLITLKKIPEIFEKKSLSTNKSHMYIYVKIKKILHMLFLYTSTKLIKKIYNHSHFCSKW